MRSTLKSLGIVALATGALGLTALPMVRVWQVQEATPGARFETDAAAVTKRSAARQQFFSPVFANLPLVVDLKDNVSDADVKDIAARYGLALRPNSIEFKDDKVMLADVPADKEADVLARLKADPRVEVAEEEQIYTLDQIEDPTVRQPQIRVTYEVFGQNGLPMQRADILPQQQILITSAPQEASPFLLNEPVPPRPDTLNDDNSGFPNDPRYKEQWNFQMIGAESAWKRARGQGITVAVIDTGVAAGPVKKGKACRDFGTTEFVEGYDFVNKSKDAFDDHGHGTHVAGTIAEATNNNEGVAGIAFEAKIMPLKVLSKEGWGTSADIADAIRFAADKGANVINMSLGSSQASDVMRKACKYAADKGVVIVCAAGNGFGAPVGYPAAFPECIAVSAVGPTGDIAKYSSYGKEVALAAPGGDMVDTRDPADGILQNTNYPESQGGKGDDYYAFQGTSMASPHVAAAAALVMSQGITDRAKVKDILEKSAVPKSDKNKYGAGILNVAQATAKAEQWQGVKLRHLLAFGLALPILFIGGYRRLGLRLAMLGAMLLGFFGPDLMTQWVGADSAWNLLTFSAFLPIVVYAFLRRGLGVKVAGALALGTAVCLYANWHNDTLPFTTATFGETALGWTATNLVAAITVGTLAARRVLKASLTRR